MSRESKLWLTAAAVVAVAVLGIVVVFGITNPPSFPSLYDGGPTVEGAVAYVEGGPDECVNVLDVATGVSREVYCADWLWLEGWDGDGNLRVNAGNGIERTLVVDPVTGAVIESGGPAGDPPSYVESLQSSAREGHVTLTYTGSGAAVTLIDVDGPRNYAFWNTGITADERYAWVSDSADRLLLVALDGTAGPWLVAENVPDARWNG